MRAQPALPLHPRIHRPLNDPALLIGFGPDGGGNRLWFGLIPLSRVLLDHHHQLGRHPHRPLGAELFPDQPDEIVDELR